MRRSKLAQNQEKRETGYVLVGFAGALVALCGVLALSVDIGQLLMERRHMQGAADSAALASAREILRGNSGLVVSAGQFDSSENGYTDGVDDVTVTINQPPTTGAFSGQPLFAEAIVSKIAPTFFMKTLGVNTATLDTRAVAGLVSDTNCLFALDPTGNNALVVTGGAEVNVPCGVQVDSDSGSALAVNGTGCLNASQIEVVGNYNGCTSPAPTTGASPMGDPLGYLAPPAVGACDQNNWSHHNDTAETIDPGVYCGGITISKGTVDLNPGMYILKGGGLTLNGTGTLNGSAVTFYNTCDSGSCASGTQGYQGITINAGTNSTLSAPTTGSWAAMLFIQDRNAPTNRSSTFNGGATMTLTGTLYFPTQSVTFSGGATTSALYTNIVAWNITFAGSTTLNHNLTPLPGGSPLKKVAMVE
jgi:hypothetical protein